jgi:2-polyprenyl-3-methyl-5-hydroxy-6-metoxy-1,4-benzoquinol methylase
MPPARTAPDADRLSRLDYTDEHVKTYVEFYAGGHRHNKIRLVTSLLPDLASQRVLDVGIGSGFFSRWCAERGARVVSIDFADAVVRYHRHDPLLTIVQADAQAMPFRKATFTCILALDVIEHLHRPTVFLDEAARVLTEHGRLILLTDNRTDYMQRVFSPLTHVARRLVRRAGRKVIKSPRSTHVRIFGARELARMLREAGFEIALVNTYSESPLYRMLRFPLRLIPSRWRGYLWNKVVFVAIRTKKDYEGGG